MPSTAFHTQSNLIGFPLPDTQFTCVLAAGITNADIGKAVSLDTSADNKVKLAGDGDVIIGRLLTVENRVNEGQLIGTVAFRFAEKLPIKAGLAGAEVVVRGSTVVGAGAGEVKARVVSAAATPDHNMNFVVKIDGAFAHVLKL
jgi:hypothetical protein